MAAEAVSVEEHLLSFVNQIAANQKFETFDIKITPVTSGGSNYTSILFKIKIIHDDRNELDLFAKVGALNENFRKQALFIFNPYDNERLFYNCLMKTYRQLEKNRRVSEKDSIKFPAYYGAKESYGREIMVLEDLASRGYGSANRFKSVDWSYAAAAITELAKFHALSLAFKHETPSEFDKFTAQFRRGLFEKCKSADIMFEGAISLALATVHKENKEKLENFLKSQDSVTYFNDLFKPLKCNVILHADFRTSNMMHKVFKVRKYLLTTHLPIRI